MNTIKPTLIFNCPENWDEMKIGLLSRYCENCKRDVHDFTTSTKEEILQFLVANKTNKVCGRIFKSQLNYHHKEILVTIESYIKKNRDSNLTFYFLAIGSIMLLGCSSNGSNNKDQVNDSLVFTLNGKEKKFNQKEVSHENGNCKIDSLLPEEFAVVGELVADDSLLNSDANGVRILAEVMPEFSGGFDSLVVYIKENLKYPEWEKKAGIQGNVFVSFTVDKEGLIIDPKILKSVHGSKNFDTEVLRLIKAMPRWKPGQEQGKNVTVQFVLPIKFAL